jgi:HPt (histidine-containing phosphotransfer) domain-containing protein
MKMKTMDLEMIDSIRELKSAEDPDIVAVVVTTFLESLSARMGEIKNAIQSADPSALEDETHSLKSSSALLGGVRMTLICAELEKKGRAKRFDGALKLFSSLHASATEFKGELEKLPELQTKRRRRTAA